MEHGILLSGAPQFERQAHGAIIVEGREVASTLQCPHCNAHFISIRGSGKRRAFCLKCKAVTCGQLDCDACIPFEKKLDRLEKQSAWESSL